MPCMATDDVEVKGLFQVHSEVFSETVLPTSPEMVSNLSDEERCARISRILMKKVLAQSLLNTLNATIFGHAFDEDDHKTKHELSPDGKIFHTVRHISSSTQERNFSDGLGKNSRALVESNLDASKQVTRKQWSRKSCNVVQNKACHQI
ncbi:hypothetical protein CEXT_29351 [Caerostris extrusa]|uniref:Uncharacterized protein n=1 Tax=Caerostris extrusa TaxID=172846 RepID=A0AAV4RVD8_CAEEX|nr:hypothetical protein CEXT_29351 [Caerostris extrusa]